MLIEMVIDVVLGLVSLLLGLLPDLPALPSVITEYWNLFIDLLGSGLSIIANWVNMQVVIPCVVIIIAVDHWRDFYGLIAWFVNKIPFLNIKM